MKLHSIVSAFTCVYFASTCYAAPSILPVPNSGFNIQVRGVDVLYPETADLVGEVYESFSLSKRDQATIESILKSINSSGIIWEILDSISSSPQQIQGLANYTTLLLGNLNISLILSLFGYISTTVNTSGIISQVEKSGLIQSVLQGTLLDEDFQTVIAHLVERVVRANEDIILFLFSTILKPASSNAKRDTSGSLTSFIGNFAGSFLNSELFSSSLGDTLGALNDTGIALYVVKRFLTTDLYVNMTGTLFNDILASGSLSINVTSLISSLNISSIVDTALSDPDLLVTTITSVLSGNFSVYTNELGQYAGAVTNIVDIVQNDGLFVELNSLLFPSTTSSGQGKDAATSTSSSTPKASSTGGSALKGGANVNLPSLIFTNLVGLLLLL